MNDHVTTLIKDAKNLETKDASLNNDEWNNAAAQNLTNATITTQQHNESNNNNHQMGATLEQLLTNNDDETKMKDRNHNNYNNTNYNDLISKMNITIETSMSLSERQQVFEILFKHGVTGVYYNSYMATSSFVNILKTCFGSYKYNINNNQLPLQSQLNLECVKLIVNNGKILQQAIESVIWKKQEKEKSQLDADYLIKYFSNYQHKYNNNNEKNDLNFIIIDMLRNLLFQVGIVCQIIRYVVFAKSDDTTRKQNANDIFNMVHKYLKLEIIDTTIENYHVSLYHIMTQNRKQELLKLLLIYTDMDWSIMKDVTGQTAVGAALDLKYKDIAQVLIDYQCTSNNDVLKSITQNDIKRFKSALVNAKKMGIVKIVSFLVASEDYKQEFFQFLIRNDGKYWWNINDYFIIIACCVKKNDFETLRLIINTINSSKYNLHKKIIPQELKWGCMFGIKNKQAPQKWRQSILDICISNKDCNFGQVSTPDVKEESKMEIETETQTQSQTEILETTNDKSNDNYQCFKLLVTKTQIRESTNQVDSQLIFDCFNNYKASFVECLIMNNILKDYTGIIAHICRYPESWKLDALRMLIEDYTYEERFYSLCKPYSKLLQGHSCLDWCVNLGLEPKWMITKLNHNYSKVNVNAAFECFKIVLNSKSPDINKLVNSTMKDELRIIDVCAINAYRGSYYSRFFRYLIDNNGKLNWKIDFVKSLVPIFATFMGDYVLLRKLFTQEIKSIELYTKEIRSIIYRILSYFNKHYLFPVAKLNDFEILPRCKRICDQKRRSLNGRETVRLLSNLLFWCLQEHNEMNVNTNDDNYVLNLLPSRQEILCFGYLRRGGIEYPDNIASILIKYFDKTIGHFNCFKYLLTNFGDQIEVYDKSIKDCETRGNEKFLTYLYNVSQINNLKPEKGSQVQHRLKAVNECIRNVIYTACKDSDYQRFKMFVDSIKDDKTFDIDGICGDLPSVCIQNVKDDVCQEDNFNVFRLLLEHNNINADSRIDLFIECVCWIRVDMVKYLIENNGKYKGWKCNFRNKWDINKILRWNYMKWWHDFKTNNRSYIEDIIEERNSMSNAMCDCITVAIITTFCQFCSQTYHFPNDKKPKFEFSLLNLLFSSDIFSKKEIIDMGEWWLKVAIMLGDERSSDRTRAVYLCFTYLVGGADGNAVDEQTGQSLIKPTNHILELLHEYDHVGPDSCLQWLLDSRVP